MTKDITNSSYWKPGQSGNPRGRPPKSRVLTEMLRVQGEELIVVGGESMTAREALAKAVWQFAISGEVWLMGKRLEANSISEWAAVVKWLYSHTEPVSRIEASDEAEMVVRVVRGDK